MEIVNAAASPICDTISMFAAWISYHLKHLIPPVAGSCDTGAARGMWMHAACVVCEGRVANGSWLNCHARMLSHLACEPKIEAVNVDMSMYWSTFANPIKWDHMAPRLTYHFEVAFIYEPWIPNKFTQKPCSQPSPLTSTLLAGQGKHPTGWASGKASGAPVAPRRGSEIGGFMGPFLDMLGSLGTEWIEVIKIMMWMIGMWSWWIVIFDIEMLSAMTCHHMLWHVQEISAITATQLLERHAGLCCLVHWYTLCLEEWLCLIIQGLSFMWKLNP